LAICRAGDDALATGLARRTMWRLPCISGCARPLDLAAQARLAVEHEYYVVEFRPDRRRRRTDLRGVMSLFSDTWVVMPVYNEAAVVGSVVELTRLTFPNVVCVDDGSSDASAAQIRAAGAHLVRHPVNLGQGAALQTGITYALGQPGIQYLVTMDSDGQHRPEDAAALVEVARSGTADVVLGSRFLNGGVGVPVAKRAILRSVAALSPASRRLQLTDAHNGLRVLTAEAAGQLRIRTSGMEHASEIVGFLASSGLRVVEAPVTILYTDYAKSKGQSLVNGINIIFDLTIRQRG
jgi:polyprenyl-phospho-N-acetylgalactosaminyl synthase